MCSRRGDGKGLIRYTNIKVSGMVVSTDRVIHLDHLFLRYNLSACCVHFRPFWAYKLNANCAQIASKTQRKPYAAGSEVYLHIHIALYYFGHKQLSTGFGPPVIFQFLPPFIEVRIWHPDLFYCWNPKFSWLFWRKFPTGHVPEFTLYKKGMGGGRWTGRGSL